MPKISAGSFDINKWLFGGYESDIISVIYGGPGTGKTNWCMLAAVSQAKKDNKIIFIDTEGGFSVERLKQLASEDHEKLLKNIFLLKPTSFAEQQEAFKKLEEHLKQEVSLIIVDSMTILYRLEFAAAKEKDISAVQKINSELVRQIKTLAQISRKKNIPIIITNQVYRWEETDKMVGGDIIHYWGKCLIELTHNKGKRTAYLRKHRSLPEKEMDFQISNTGIKKRSWL